MTVVHNTTQNSSDNLRSYLQTSIIAQMLSIREGVLQGQPLLPQPVLQVCAEAAICHHRL